MSGREIVVLILIIILVGVLVAYLGFSIWNLIDLYTNEDYKPLK